MSVEAVGLFLAGQRLVAGGGRDGLAPAKATAETATAVLSVPAAAGLVHAMASFSFSVWHRTRLQAMLESLASSHQLAC